MLTVSQRQLNLRHYFRYYKGEIDGIAGPLYNTAILSFQKDHGLTPDGVYGSKTDAMLIDCIKDLQGLLGVTQDGLVGALTIAAIKSTQKRYGLVQDGIAGQKTFAVLDKPSGSSNHFAKSEFECQCGGRYCNGYPSTIDPDLLVLLERLRGHYGKPIIIRSGLRCATWNRKQGGVANSRHLYGKAADIYIGGQSDTKAGRNDIINMAYQFGARYAYGNTSGMGQSVHVDVT